MAPTVHLVRHAQGYHNLNIANHALHDPVLTSLGKEQCATLQANFPHHKDIDLVVASPLRRTLQTALYSFDNDIRTKKLKVIGMPELQETSDLPCDTGSNVDELKREFANFPVDLSLVGEGWNSKRGIWATGADAIRARAKVARTKLAAFKEKDIVVVTHGGFLHFLTEDWSDSGRFLGTGWANTEYRSYNFSDDGEFHLIETPESRARRHRKELDHNEVEQIKRTKSHEAAEQAKKDAVVKPVVSAKA